jgi:hypothetical protein
MGVAARKKAFFRASIRHWSQEEIVIKMSLSMFPNIFSPRGGGGGQIIFVSDLAVPHDKFNRKLNLHWKLQRSVVVVHESIKQENSGAFRL